MADTNPVGGPQLNLGPIGDLPKPQAPGSESGKATKSFQDMFTGFLKDVNDLQNQADQGIEKMMSGEVKDVHQVMLAVGEAKVAFNLLLEIRNKTMDAYQEIMRMRG